MKRAPTKWAGLVLLLLLVGLLVSGQVALGQLAGSNSLEDPAPSAVDISDDQGGQAAPEKANPDWGTTRAQADIQAGSGNLGFFTSYSIPGGYAAQGMGLRNRGWGMRWLSDIPAGATVYKAYLYWAVIGASTPPAYYAQGRFKGNLITGTLLGSDAQPCWGQAKIYAYRADVTPYVTGNGVWWLTDFASGRRAGEDPWLTSSIAPLIEGASLVVVYQKAGYPLTNIRLYDGAASSNTGNIKTLTISGFTATNPVGPAWTTFIGADGQSAGEPGSTFRGVALPTVDWDGTDPQAGPNFSQGNLWDTDTVNVGRILRAGDVSAVATVRGGPDCLTWVAQVFSISPGNVDTDGDALLDGWEANGYDDNNDNIVDVNLPAMGASHLHKDIFVESDWMTAAAHHHKPNATVLNRIRDVFAAAPVSNPDGVNGINIHVDVGQAPYSRGNSIAEVTNLGTFNPDGSYNWTAFQNLKNTHFNNNRRRIFHYMIWSHQIGTGTISGISRGIPASDFIVSLGGWGAGDTDNARTGTFIHELGHNLGLRHGGDDHANYEPNYLSVMNYFFQISGVYRGGSWGNFDYSRFLVNALNENALNETVGLDPNGPLAGYGTKYYCPNATVRDILNAAGAINWNCDGDSTDTSVAVDINNSGARSTLSSQNNWANIVYDGGDVGGVIAILAPLPMTTPANELTLEEWLKISKSSP